jgi:alpha/beta hydrolase family protein
MSPRASTSASSRRSSTSCSGSPVELVADDRVGDELFGCAATTERRAERVRVRVAPRERAALVAAFTGGGDERDNSLVDRERVAYSGPAGCSGAISVRRGSARVVIVSTASTPHGASAGASRTIRRRSLDGAYRLRGSTSGVPPVWDRLGMTGTDPQRSTMPTWHAFQRDGARLAWLDFGGAGPAILLLHGLAGHASEWAETAGWLTQGHRVLALDLRGHGGSERTPDDVTRAAHVADVAFVIEGLRLGPVVLVGQSWAVISRSSSRRATPSSSVRLSSPRQAPPAPVSRVPRGSPPRSAPRSLAGLCRSPRAKRQ